MSRTVDDYQAMIQMGIERTLRETGVKPVEIVLGAGFSNEQADELRRRFPELSFRQCAEGADVQEVEWDW